MEKQRIEREKIMKKINKSHPIKYNFAFWKRTSQPPFSNIED